MSKMNELMGRLLRSLDEGGPNAPPVLNQELIEAVEALAVDRHPTVIARLKSLADRLRPRSNSPADVESRDVMTRVLVTIFQGDRNPLRIEVDPPKIAVVDSSWGFARSRAEFRVRIDRQRYRIQLYLGPDGVIDDLWQFTEESRATQCVDHANRLGVDLLPMLQVEVNGVLNANPDLLKRIRSTGAGRDLW